MTDIIQTTTTKPESTYLGKLAQYNITKTLGVEHLYPVYLAETADSTETFVVKTMNANDASFLNESNVFALPEHKNIIKAKDLLSNVSADIKTDKTRGLETQQSAVVMEFAENGDMFNYAVQGAFSEKIARYFFEQILNALEHLHSNSFCHLDIKLENILLDKDFTVKLTDFGFASKLEEGKRLYKKVGTPGYKAPEMWKVGSNFTGYDGVKADVFQLGVLLFIITTGMVPFAEANGGDVWYRPALNGKWDIFWNLKEKALRSRKSGLKTFDANFKELMTRLLNPDDSKRPSIQEIKESAWFKSVEPATYEEVLAEMNMRKLLIK